MVTEPRDTYVLWGLSPESDLIDPRRAREALDAAGRVIACSAFLTPDLEAVADVLLPIAGFAETSGTFVNAEGRWQRFQGAVAPPGEARPGWKVLRVLGNMLELDGFAYASGKQVHDELAALCADRELDNARRGDYGLRQASLSADGLTRVGAVPIYSLDQTTRAAAAVAAAHAAGGAAGTRAAPGRRGPSRPGRGRSGAGLPGRGGGLGARGHRRCPGPRCGAAARGGARCRGPRSGHRADRGRSHPNEVRSESA
jgi:NADH-quinone oxidoreductase subunit G